ncbi:hypothetical protein [Nostoc sp. NMS4]|uniref:hypothetical protein n=1 Tax=Nostoc sp. NMS4 TaxID=2815390 RepID=UPI0025E6786B|nr:hypothetical protein [Nostoc sp. NMS4]
MLEPDALQGASPVLRGRDYSDIVLLPDHGDTLTADLALCWVHEARHYKKLSPFVACHRQSLDEFLDDFWKYFLVFISK